MEAPGLSGSAAEVGVIGIGRAASADLTISRTIRRMLSHRSSRTFQTGISILCSLLMQRPGSRTWGKVGNEEPDRRTLHCEAGHWATQGIHDLTLSEP